ncbi:MAG: hypothetical protein FWG92_07175 [Leptospirales bacterium]|nr:hypothetical protein [Leptospirales bacterium]
MKKIIILYLLLAVSLLPLFAQQNNQQGAQNQQRTAIPEGYGSLTWGTMLSAAKDKIEGKLAFTDDQRVIISKDGELEYYYGFFYMDPAKYERDAQANDGNAQTGDEGKLFYVALKFPYLTAESIREKLVGKYGDPVFEEIINGRGPVAWDSDKTIMIMWVDLYEGKPYCRRITYISKETTKELNAYVHAMFNKIEIDVIKRLNP